MTNWIFQTPSGMGDITGEAVRNTLLAQSLNQAEILSREGIQNSTDAALEGLDDKVKVVFRLVNLFGVDKVDFLKNTINCEDFEARKNVLGLQPGNCIDSIDDPEVPLKLLYIEDYGTHGIYGDPHKTTSHFHKLLFSLGDGSKARNDSGTGGSYGFGKAAYAGNSKIYTIFAYSYFDERKIEDNITSRLIGCGYFQGHHYNEQDYPGRCWFGIEDSKTNYQQRVHPFVNDEAHNLAKKLRFSIRDSSLTGTSILLVDSEISSINDLRKAIEDWWWPRIYENTLDVELYEDEVLQEPPRPRNRPDLRPFIDCFDLALGITESTKNTQKKFTLKKIENTDIGTLGCSLIQDELAEDENLIDRLGTIALIRNKRMVVSYLSARKGDKAVAAYVADSNEYLNNVLKLSEPPTHTQWDPKTQRLNIPEDKSPGLAKRIVESTLENIKNNFRRFINETQDVETSAQLRPKVLEKLLGNLFRPIETSAGINPDKEVDPISITEVEDYFEVVNEKIRTCTNFIISLSPKAEEKSSKITLTITCQPKTDEGTDDFQIPIEVSSENGYFKIVNELPKKIEVNLEEDSKIKFKVVSAEYDSNWTADISINAERSN